MILVGPRTQLAAMVAEHKPSRIVSLRSPDAERIEEHGLAEGHVLHLAFNDVAEDRPGLVSPTRDHVEALLAFAQAWDRTAPLLIQCYAGISRSTAAALIVAAALEPRRGERELAQTVRRLSPEATPNPLLIHIADEVLGRRGRLTEAVRGIGRGAEAFEGRVFLLPLQDPR